MREGSNMPLLTAPVGSDETTDKDLEAKEGEAEASTAAREEAEQLLIVKLSSSQRAKLGINYSVFITCI